METSENTPTPSAENERKIWPVWMVRIGSAVATLWTSYPISLVFGSIAIVALFLDVLDAAVKETPEAMMLGLKVPAALMSLFLGVALDMLRSTRDHLAEVSRRSDAVEEANKGALRLVDAIHEDTQHLIRARQEIERHDDDAIREIGRFTIEYIQKEKYKVDHDFLTVSTPHLSYRAYVGFWDYCAAEQETIGTDEPGLEIKALHVWSAQFWRTRTGSDVLELSKAFISHNGTIERILVQRTHKQDRVSVDKLLDIISRMTEIGITVYYINREALDLTPQSFAVISHPNGNQYSVSLTMEYKPREPIKAFIRKNSPEVRAHLRAWEEVKGIFLDQGHAPFTKENPPTREAIAQSSLLVPRREQLDYQVVGADHQEPDHKPNE